jgi:hypothetical protein
MSMDDFLKVHDRESEFFKCFDCRGMIIQMSRRTETGWIPEIFKEKRRAFTKSMAERRPPVPLAQMNLTLLDSVCPSDYHESLEEALEISAIAARFSQVNRRDPRDAAT